VERPTPPRPDKVRQLGGFPFAWLDVRIKDFMDAMTQEELLLYFFLLSAGNEQGCSWWSTRQITKKLKIGPASLIRSRRMLEERNLIATRQDEFSQRTIYQLLDLPIETIRESIEIPKIKEVQKTSGSRRKVSGKTEDSATDEAREVGFKFLEEIGKKLNNS
jgi:hypothetical protein